MNKLSSFLPIALCSLTFTVAQATCGKPVNYQFTNNLPHAVALREISGQRSVITIQHIIPSHEKGTVKICTITGKRPSIVISDLSSMAVGKVNYRFMFKPAQNSFSGEPFNNMAFSWGRKINRHIFLCTSSDYMHHGGTCRF